MPTMTTDYSKIPLKTLLSIRENQYRSKSCHRDYDPELIEQEIWRKQDQLNEKQIRRRFKELDELEKSKQDLKNFLNSINTNGKQFLTEKTLNQIVTDLAIHMADHL